MIKYENHCCDCAVPGYPCIGNSCPYIDIPVYYCDSCNDDTLAVCIIDANEHKMNIHESLKEMRKYSADFKEKHEAYLKKYTI